MNVSQSVDSDRSERISSVWYTGTSDCAVETDRTRVTPKKKTVRTVSQTISREFPLWGAYSLFDARSRMRRPSFNRGFS